jgi:hypothetical protein
VGTGVGLGVGTGTGVGVGIGTGVGVGFVCGDCPFLECELLAMHEELDRNKKKKSQAFIFFYRSQS